MRDDAEIKAQMASLMAVVEAAEKAHPAATRPVAAEEAPLDEAVLLAQQSTVRAEAEAEAETAVRATELATPQVAALYPTQGVDYHSKAKWVVEALEAQQVLGSIRQYPTWRGLSGRFNAATGVLLARGAKPAASSAPVRMVLTADWASGTVESDYVGQLMASEKGRPDWTLNAGDVYWTGTPTNVKQTCLGKPKNNDPGQRGVKWPSGRLGSFAVLGNHEMYNRGDAFFDLWMPTLGTKSVRQFAGYAALETADWRVLMLDTGFGSYDKWGTNQPADNTDMPQQLYDWLVKEVGLSDPDDKRGVLVITHHQPNTAFEEPFQLPAQGLASRLPPGRQFYWLFGHEHKLSFYDISTIQTPQGYTVSYIGRCIGNGGFPTNLVPLASTPKPAGSGKLLGYDARVYQTLPEAVDPKPELGDHGIQKTFNGWVDLTFTGPELAVSYRSLKLSGAYATNAASDEFARETLTVDGDGNVQFKSPLKFTAMATKVGKPAATTGPSAKTAKGATSGKKTKTKTPKKTKTKGKGKSKGASKTSAKKPNKTTGTKKTTTKKSTGKKTTTKKTTTKKPTTTKKTATKKTTTKPKSSGGAWGAWKAQGTKAAKCSAHGQTGQCQNKSSSSCGGTWVSGRCAGAANIVCCLPKKVSATARFLQKEDVHQHALEPAQMEN